MRSRPAAALPPLDSDKRHNKKGQACGLAFVVPGWVLDSALRLRLRRRPAGTTAVAVAALGHELVELRLVLRRPQPLHKVAELARLLFQAPQRLLPVLVEGAVAGRRVGPPLHAE